jgi:hypothetical protein
MRKAPLRRAAVALGLTVIALLAAACGKKPKAGEACKTAGEVQCADKKTGLFCVAGKWEPLACEGPTGCMSVAGTGSCNHSEYAVGEACLKDGEPACTGDHKAMIKCEASHWKLIDKCNGTLGCVSSAQGTKCDLGASTEGSPCTKENEGNASCTPDAKGLLLCKGGKMTLAAKCKGMHGCRQKGTELECDETMADLGDVCDSSEYEGKFACTTDKKMRLVCKSNKMVKDRACRCSVMIDKVNCD